MADNNQTNTVPNYTAGFQPIPPAGGTPSATVFTPPKSPGKKLGSKNIILMGVLVLVLAGLILGFGKARSFLSKASGGGGCEPSNIREANLTSSSVEITFQTEKACLAEANYGISQDGMLLSVPEAMASLNHRVRLSPLLPSTTYYYQIKIDGKKSEPVRNFLTMAVAKPTAPPVVIPTSPPATGSARTQADFEEQLGTANPAFDIDKNGIVNISDWMLYQKTQ